PAFRGLYTGFCRGCGSDAASSGLRKSDPDGNCREISGDRKSDFRACRNEDTDYPGAAVPAIPDDLQVCSQPESNFEKPDSRCDGGFCGMVAVFAGIFYLHRPDTGNGQYVRQSDHAGTDHALAVFLYVDPADRS